MTSPTEDENIDNNNDILFVKNIESQKMEPEMQEDEEHNKLEEEILKDGKN